MVKRHTDDAQYKKARTTWAMMRQRCYNSSYVTYVNYGARGIRICDRWLKFENFYLDMFPQPQHRERLTIDRIDNNGNYQPDNCRWATYSENTSNQRRSVKLEFEGKIWGLKALLVDQADKTGIPEHVLRSRINCGMEPERAFVLPYVCRSDAKLVLQSGREVSMTKAVKEIHKKRPDIYPAAIRSRLLEGLTFNEVLKSKGTKRRKRLEIPLAGDGTV